MSVVLGAKVSEDVAARLSKLALQKGKTVSDLVRIGIEKVLREAAVTPEEKEQVDSMSRKRARDISSAIPKESFDGAMFIDRVWKLVTKEKLILSAKHKLESDDYDHLINLAKENIKVAKGYPQGDWIEKWLNRLVKELEEEKSNV